MDQTLSAQHSFGASWAEFVAKAGSVRSVYLRQFVLGFVATMTVVVSLGGLPAL